MDAFVGEIRAFAGTYAPYGWLDCDGSDLLINEFQALFAVITFTYGPQSQRTFRLPDLRGRTPMGLSTDYPGLWCQVGTETKTVGSQNLPPHTHLLHAGDPTDAQPAYSAAPSNTMLPSRAIAGLPPPSTLQYGQFSYSQSFPTHNMDDRSIGVAGGVGTPPSSVKPVENRQPYTAMRFIICWDGTFPERD